MLLISFFKLCKLNFSDLIFSRSNFLFKKMRIAQFAIFPYYHKFFIVQFVYFQEEFLLFLEFHIYSIKNYCYFE